MLNSPKLAILQRLEELDQRQMDEVLGYIRQVLHRPDSTSDHQSFKRKALKEIRQALRKEKKQEVRVAA